MDSGCQRRGDGDNRKDQSEGDSQGSEEKIRAGSNDGKTVKEDETEETGRRKEQEIKKKGRGSDELRVQFKGHKQSPH